MLVLNWASKHPNYYVDNDNNFDSGINLEEEFQKRSEQESTSLQFLILPITTHII